MITDEWRRCLLIVNWWTNHIKSAGIILLLLTLDLHWSPVGWGGCTSRRPDTQMNVSSTWIPAVIRRCLNPDTPPYLHHTSILLLTCIPPSCPDAHLVFFIWGEQAETSSDTETQQHQGKRTCSTQRKTSRGSSQCQCCRFKLQMNLRDNKDK